MDKAPIYPALSGDTLCMNYDCIDEGRFFFSRTVLIPCRNGTQHEKRYWYIIYETATIVFFLVAMTTVQHMFSSVHHSVLDALWMIIKLFWPSGGL